MITFLAFVYIFSAFAYFYANKSGYSLLRYIWKRENINIYLSTDHGRLMVIDIQSGRTKSILKIDNDKISRPFVLDKNLYVVKENAIIKLD